MPRGRPKGSKNKKTKEPPKSRYTITLEVNGVKLVSQNDDLERAILSLELPEKFTTKGVFTLEADGKVSRSVPFLIFQLRRLFAAGLTGQTQRAVLMKRLLL